MSEKIFAGFARISLKKRGRGKSHLGRPPTAEEPGFHYTALPRHLADKHSYKPSSSAVSTASISMYIVQDKERF